VHTLVETNGPLLVELLSARGSEVARQVTMAGELVSETIDQRGAAIIDSLGSRQLQLTSAIDKSSSDLRLAIDSSAGESINSLVHANANIRSEMSAVLDALSKANGSLDQILNNAGQNLGNVESALTSRVREFQTALATISTQVMTLTQSSAQTIESADSLAMRLERQNLELSTSASELARTQVQLDQTLDARQKALDRLVTMVHSRTEDFETVTRSFTALVEESFKKAEARAREIGTLLSDETQAVTDLIGNQFEQVRDTTGKERERTAAALRAAYDQANAEMSQIFSGSIEKFKESTAQMQTMTTDIQRELDATREELRRGALELPREASEQTSAMRRVISEQIKALNELTDIVAKSGRAYDVVEPRRQESGRQESTREPARTPEPARTEPFRIEQPRQATPRPTSPAPPALREEPQPTPPPVQRPRAPQPPAAPAAPRPAAAVGDNRNGWLSDLLARASRDDTPTPPAPRVIAAGPPPTTPARPQQRPADSLDAISHDIARMVEHDAVAALWDRYYRGDQNIFSRRLYTSAGQQTFDEIRRRYRDDREFHDTVDRYMQEFERLLAEIGREDRDGSLTRSYLTSDTGKVYTMFAHAAERYEAI
jgi:hypothetical protein